MLDHGAAFGFDCADEPVSCDARLRQPGKNKGLNALNGTATSNIDAEYEALCAEYEGALV